MANFMFAYYGGKSPSSIEESIAQMDKWKTWVRSLGDIVISPVMPLKGTRIVTSSDIQNEDNPNAMNGFAVIKSEHIEAAVEIAKSDPILDIGGTIHVSEMMEID